MLLQFARSAARCEADGTGNPVRLCLAFKAGTQGSSHLKERACMSDRRPGMRAKNEPHTDSTKHSYCCAGVHNPQSLTASYKIQALLTISKPYYFSPPANPAERGDIVSGSPGCAQHAAERAARGRMSSQHQFQRRQARPRQASTSAWHDTHIFMVCVFNQWTHYLIL
jgi:hypothetical protein